MVIASPAVLAALSKSCDTDIVAIKKPHIFDKLKMFQKMFQ
jgi:hypothetical protein